MESRRVLVRINMDVPLENQKILNDNLLKTAMPTIDYLIENGARVVLCGHMGDAGGKVVPELSLEPIAAWFAARQHIGEVYLTDSCVGDAAKSVIAGLREGQVCVLENLGFHAGEIKNDEKLSRQLASYCDIYVNEAFSLSEQVLASTNGILKHARIKVTGLQYAKELKALRKFLGKPERPVMAILGGDRIADNLELLESLLGRIDSLVLGGQMTNTFTAATGGSTGKAVVEEKRLPLARDLLDRTARKNIKLILPSDVRAGITADAVTEYAAGEVPESANIFDIGSHTEEFWKQLIRKAGTIVWKGHLGMAARADSGTYTVARAIAGAAAYSLSLGEESAEIIRTLGLEKGFDHVSDGGDATIRMVEGKTLPTVLAMGNAQTMK
ncbi:MAG: phosphoglycerate kinase [Deltaproteobacteria bacterium]|nr:phosphoglycerate kinase [Deltaproteobacteria bacterium]